jgi:uncharacterized membrane protein YgdD (TMEM256/DUF423 family)
MSRLFIIAGALAAGIAVVAGAFGAHGLEGRVTAGRLETFKTGVTYQGASGPVTWAGYAFIAGIVIFSGSLYLLVLTDTGWLGAITPIGGVAFIIGWILLAYGMIDPGW